MNPHKRFALAAAAIVTAGSLLLPTAAQAAPTSTVVAAATAATLKFDNTPTAGKTTTAKVSGYTIPSTLGMGDVRVVWTVAGKATQKRTLERSDAYKLAVLESHAGKAVQAKVQQYSPANGTWKTVATSAAVTALSAGQAAAANIKFAFAAAPAIGKTATAKVTGFKLPATASNSDFRVVWVVGGKTTQTRTLERSDAYKLAIVAAHGGKALQVKLQENVLGNWKTIGTSDAVTVLTVVPQSVTFTFANAPTINRATSVKLGGYKLPAGVGKGSVRVVWLIDGKAAQTRTLERADVYKFTPAAAHAKKSLTVRVQQLSSGSWKTVATSQAVTVAEKVAAAAATLKLSASPTVGKTATATLAGYKQPTSVGKNGVRVVWLVGGTAVQTRTLERSDAYKFTPTSAHGGKKVAARVQQLSGGAWKTIVTSASSTVITAAQAAAPALKLNITPAVGKTVTATTVRYTPKTGVSLADTRVVWTVGGVTVQTRTLEKANAYQFVAASSHKGKKLVALLQERTPGAWKTVATSPAATIK